MNVQEFAEKLKSKGYSKATIEWIVMQCEDMQNEHTEINYSTVYALLNAGLIEM